MASVRGKVVWLTGASSGIGEALARELGRRGARLAISARRADILSSLAKDIVAAGGECISLPVDVTDLGALKAVGARIEAEMGPVDILIANAGSHLFSKPEQFDSKEYLALMDLNFGGVLRTIEVVLPSMLARRSGHIVGVASLAGYRGLPRAAAYVASKAAQIHFLESLRFHTEQSQIAVSIVNPGFVKTPLTDENDFHMPFLMPADAAARRIADGIERQEKEIAFPWPFHWILKLGRVIPYPIYEFIVGLVWSRMEAGRRR